MARVTGCAVGSGLQSRRKRKVTRLAAVVIAAIYYAVIRMTRPNESEQRDLATQFFTDVLIDELRKRDYVVLAKQHHAVLVENAEAALERTDIPR